MIPFEDHANADAGIEDTWTDSCDYCEATALELVASLAGKETDPDDTNIWRDRPDRCDGFVGDHTENAVEQCAIPSGENPGEIQTEGSDCGTVITRDPAALPGWASGRRALTIEIAGRIIETVRKQQFAARTRQNEQRSNPEHRY